MNNENAEHADDNVSEFLNEVFKDSYVVITEDSIESTHQVPDDSFQMEINIGQLMADYDAMLEEREAIYLG